MQNFFSGGFIGGVLGYAMRHKVISAVVIIILGLGVYAGLRMFGGTTGSRYVMTAVQKGSVIVSVTGSGQVSASDQIDLKSKVSGTVVYAVAKSGQEVKAGALIVQLDSTAAEKTVRDAEVNLDSAKLSFQKLQQPADALSLLQAENALTQAEDAKQTATDNLRKSFDDAFNAVSSAFLDLPQVMNGVQDLLYSTTISPTSFQANIDYYTNAAAVYDDRALAYRDDTNTKYHTALAEYNHNFDDYKSSSRSASATSTEILLNETYETTKAIADAVKSANDLIQFYEDQLAHQNLKPAALAGTHLATLNADTGKTNSDLSSLLSVINAIQSARNTITTAGQSIAEKSASLDKLKAGADPIDIQSQQLSIKQRENSLLDAQQALADYFIRAPFDGTIAKINVKKSDSAGSGTAVATFITKNRLAQISLNEIDAAKITVGQKATLTFDAIDGLSISGQVAEVDTVGTVTQGVVTYGVQIGFDTQNSRVKPGMSVNAAIITDVKQDVLVLPNSAVKTQGGAHYVEVFAEPVPQNQTSQGFLSLLPPVRAAVEIGLSNDTSVEIVSGLKEGDQVVLKTILSAAPPASPSSAPSLLPTGGRGGGGGAFRGGG